MLTDGLNGFQSSFCQVASIDLRRCKEFDFIICSTPLSLTEKCFLLCSSSMDGKMLGIFNVHVAVACVADFDCYKVVLTNDFN
jgi:hypothetical protein